ncbi:hypothetical protein lerEdw1_015459 [Lerista edwardsae]|nr:hypothetical protein lerEdw1_015459 [Lerista edwardsae]
MLSPKQLAEVSRLLKQYQINGRPVSSTAEELYKYLHGTGPNGCLVPAARALRGLAMRSLVPLPKLGGRSLACRAPALVTAEVEVCGGDLSAAGLFLLASGPSFCPGLSLAAADPWRNPWLSAPAQGPKVGFKMAPARFPAKRVGSKRACARGR